MKANDRRPGDARQPWLWPAWARLSTGPFSVIIRLMSAHPEPPLGEPFRLPEHGSCFVCGHENPKGMGLVWYARTGGRHGLLVTAEFQFSLAEQGPPGHAHGGASAAVIDEVMGAVVWRAGLKAVLGNLNVNYHRPVPLQAPLRAEGWVQKQNGRLAHATGHILLPDGTPAVVGTGLYVHAPHLFSFDYYG